MLESVLAGLAHAHAGYVVHRDLKPENLMVTDDGHVKITDFGIAKALIDSGTVAFRTATGAAIGTPAYMSPEQAMGEGVGPWTDLYATGVIAYELLSGSVPFGNREPIAILLAHCQEAPVPLAERAPDVPAPIAAWVDALLAKAPPTARPPPRPPGRSSRSTCSSAPARAGAAAPGSRASRAPSDARPAGRSRPPSSRATRPRPATGRRPAASPPPEPARRPRRRPRRPPAADQTAPLARPPRRRAAGSCVGAGLAAVAVVGVALALTLPGDAGDAHLARVHG